MTKPLTVRRLAPKEGLQLKRIVRRGRGKTDKSHVKWRRALVVHASAVENSVSAIAVLVVISEDRVREMIHRFNDKGMSSLTPKNLATDMATIRIVGPWAHTGSS